MNVQRLAATACVAALAAVPALAEDLTIVYKTTSPNGPGTATSYFSTDRMRMTDADRDTVVEYSSGRIVTLDHKKKEYSEVTLAEIEAAMKAAGEQMQKASEQMANMPPAMREKMQQMMAGPTATVTKGATRKVAGYDCQDYDVALGTMMTMHLCSTTAIAPPAPNVDYRNFTTLAGAAANPMLKNLVNEMKKVQGFTLAQSSSMKMMGRSAETSMEATEVKKGAIPAATFDVATLTKGYKKVESPTSRMRK
jgi:hypothetical protein